MPQTSAPANKPVKHRACDECRTRKLACSKDPDGCERCRRENIVCHYSEQKPMGRPRKRQFIETTREEPTNNANIDIDVSALPLVADDLEGYNDSNVAEPYFTNTQSSYGLRPEPTSEQLMSKLDNGRTIWHFGDGDIMNGPHINFGNIDFGPPDGPLPSLDSAPQLTTSNASVSDSEQSTPQALPLGPCSCLPSMYLSLSALQTLPTDIVVALKTVRSAAATAASCIWCAQCGAIVLDNPNPPIESFQNTMLLGTILPIIANSYQKLLKMVDDETDAAEAAGETKTFRFQDYGGLCGKQKTVEHTMACLDKELMFNAVEMPAHQWRTTVRALLRVDIYGHEQDGFRHKGLKDLVGEMELRQRTRHDMLDAHVAAGNMEYGSFGQKLCLGEQTHGCLQILKMAKVAIDALVIA
ncbi:uncharacterized protein LY89DRAFT_579338 [Mollisia scopiformis]|uniref:Zn(2)-C6 fungal-type domain-containing protein n=1 Tax=Mollisia scopiformis TaxID=149040 RepID=A0A194XL75_MOLSC|nr:uncharacterized protein LY89DRAFT_579338 [Mollisia scopiformis]KUJ20527.1 hypothetical protein LY89DRAFT_579338 [Mollisia scopiformis]